jgi:hypothetical protein
MHIWADIFTRELVMLMTLLALGSGPASFLGRRFDAAARLAMAPVLGLCLGTCVFTTLIWFTATGNTYWLLPVLAIISVAIALWRGLAAVSAKSAEARRRSRVLLLVRRLRVRDAFALLVVCVVVTAPLNYTLHERHSVGPIGFEVWDTVGYTAEIDGMTQQSIRVAADHDYATAKSFIYAYWEFYAAGNQNLDAAPLSANLNELIGLHATDTQSLFLIVFLLAGALGAFASVRYAAPKPFWAAPLAGVLFAGPFFMQLIADGSQAAICGLSVILPIFAVGADALRNRGRPFASLALLALLLSGLVALYPLFVPEVAISAMVVLLAVTILAQRRGNLSLRTFAGATGAIVVVVAMTVVLNVVSFLRDVGYWHDVLNGAHIGSGLPQYALPVSVLPGWLLQTREFYSLTNLAHAPFHEVLTGVALPAILIAAIIAGLWYRRRSLILIPLILACAALAEYTSVNRHCSYCVDRNSLPIAPLAIGLLALGIAALATAPRRWLRWSGVIVAIVAVIAVASRTRQERLRFSDDSYFLDASNRALLSHLPSNAGTVDLEGYGEDPGKATGELPLLYFLASERNHGAVSVPSEYTDYASLAYLGESNPANPEFNPDYRYVLTRLGGLQTGRRTIARTGSLALQERTGPLDATVVSGIAVPPVRQDALGLAWIEGPVHMLLVGGGSAPAWISLRFKAIVPVKVPRQPGVRVQFRRHGELAACVRATGTAPIRKATITLSFPLVPGIVPSEPFALPEPPQGVQLVAMQAVNHCALTGGGRSAAA